MTEQPRFCQNPGCGVQLRAVMGDGLYLCRGCTERMKQDQAVKDERRGDVVVGYCVALAAALAALGGATLYLAGRD